MWDIEEKQIRLFRLKKSTYTDQHGIRREGVREIEVVWIDLADVKDNYKRLGMPVTFHHGFTEDGRRFHGPMEHNGGQVFVETDLQVVDNEIIFWYYEYVEGHVIPITKRLHPERPANAPEINISNG